MNEVLTAILNICAIIAAVIAVPLLYRRCRLLFKRISMASKLRHACKAHGAELFPTHALWMFGRNGGAVCDFFIVGKHIVYAVKLFSVRLYHTELHFTDDGKYFIRHYFAFAAGRLGMMPTDSKRRSISACDFTYKFQKEWYMKKVCRILLVNPTPYEIRYDTREGSRILGAGDTADDMQIYTISKFITRLDADTADPLMM